MKNNKIKKIILPIILILLVVAGCEREQSGKYEMTTGKPTISYIRYQSKDSEEQLLEGAFMNENIVIIGENLTSIQEVWFNNIKALLNINIL